MPGDDRFDNKDSGDGVDLRRVCGVVSTDAALEKISSGLKDNGTRQDFGTGAVREVRDPEKGRFDLIPAFALKMLAIHYARGAVKYAPRNWEKGLPLSSFVDSAERHINAYKEGDRAEDHWSAVAWNAFGFLWTSNEILAGRLPRTLDDGGYLGN